MKITMVIIVWLFLLFFRLIKKIHKQKEILGAEKWDILGFTFVPRLIDNEKVNPKTFIFFV